MFRTLFGFGRKNGSPQRRARAPKGVRRKSWQPLIEELETRFAPSVDIFSTPDGVIHAICTNDVANQVQVLRDPGVTYIIDLRRYTPMVLGTCRRVLRNAHDAEDICQTTFLILVHKASGIRKRESLGGWLHRVAYRLARDLAAQRARRAAEPLSGAEIAGRVDQAAEPS